MRPPRFDIPSHFRRLLAADAGSIAAEFAVAATVALALIFAVVDVGRAYIVNGLLGDAARQISRENQVRLSPYSAAEFDAAAETVIETRSAGMLEPDLVGLSTSVYDDFTALAQGQEDAGAPPGGEPGQIVRYRLTYQMDFYTPFVGLVLEGANFDQVAEIIVYNEPEPNP